MIIDRVSLSGEEAYFKDSNGNLNLAAALPSTARTKSAGKGRQLDVRGIELYLEGPDLWPWFQRQDKPLLRITVMKEILPGLFADPYRHRVHTIAGFNDFNDGKFTNCQAFEVEGEPTIVALEPGICTWRSARYELPHAVDFVQAAWSLASARPLPNITSSSDFTYDITVSAFNGNGGALNAPPVARNLTAKDQRSAAFGVAGVQQFYVEFEADTSADGYFHEHHGSAGLGQIGRPLFRSFQLLETVKCEYEFFSLAELTVRASGYDLLGATSERLPRLAATLRLPATLVSGPNEDVAQNLFEFVAIELDPLGVLPDGSLTYASARLAAQVAVRPPSTIVP
jgi:hypothetical protein